MHKQLHDQRTVLSTSLRFMRERMMASKATSMTSVSIEAMVAIVNAQE